MIARWKRSPGLLHLLAAVSVLLLADQISKHAVRTALSPGDSVPIFGEVVRITYVQNESGFSWWVPPLPAWAAFVLQILLALIAIAAFPVYLFYTHTQRQSAWATVACVCIVGSCLGHLADNLFAPFTTDFIQILRSPSANMADLYSYVGIGALLVEAKVRLCKKRPRWQGFRHLLHARAALWQRFLAFLRAQD